MSVHGRATNVTYPAGPLSNRWFSVPARCAAPKFRMVCFPYAGAGASVYFTWAKHLAARGIELWNVQYPGRESRISDPPVRVFSALVEQVTNALLSLEVTDSPFTLFGHSLGAILAYEVASQLARQKRRLPAGLLLSGRNAPSHRRRPPRLHDLPPDELLDAVAEFGNLSEAVRNEPELVELLMPALRADFALVHDYHERWDWRAAVPLSCRLSVFGGEQDPWTDRNGLAAWGQFVRGPCRLRTYAGGHFFINDFRQDIWNAVEEDLDAIGTERDGANSL